MNVQLLQYHQQKTEQPYYRCHLCASDDLRISATIECSVRPNDPHDPVEDYSMLKPYAEWSSGDDAHCETCGWIGTVAVLQEFEAMQAVRP